MNNPNQENDSVEKKTRKAPTPKGLKLTDMVQRLGLPLDAILPLITLSFGPATREQLFKAGKRDGTNVGAGIARLVEEKLIEARDGALHMRPIESWESDKHFMAALAVRW